MNIDKQTQDLIKDQSSKAIKFANEVKITSKESMDSAVELLVKVRQAEKFIKDKKESITKPINAGLKEVRAFFKPFETQVLEAKSNLNSKIIDFQKVLEKREEEKIAKIEKQVEEEKIDLDKAEEKIAKISVDKKVETENGKLTFKTVRKVVIEDESKLPRKYLVPDNVKIRREALMGVKIDGVKVVEEKQTMVNY